MAHAARESRTIPSVHLDSLRAALRYAGARVDRLTRLSPRCARTGPIGGPSADLCFCGSGRRSPSLRLTHYARARAPQRMKMAGATCSPRPTLGLGPRRTFLTPSSSQFPRRGRFSNQREHTPGARRAGLLHRPQGRALDAATATIVSRPGSPRADRKSDPAAHRTPSLPIALGDREVAAECSTAAGLLLVCVVRLPFWSLTSLHRRA